MSRLIGYVANRGDRLRAALYQERHAVEARDEPGGWGLGFYQGDEVLHKKRPRHTGGAFAWGNLAKDVRSDCVLLHLRRPSVGDYTTENTHPFRMRSWLFAHAGTIDRFDLIEDRLRNTLPDFVSRNIRGQTDSELFFHLVLSLLHDEGQLDTHAHKPELVVRSLKTAVSLVERLASEVGGEPGASTLDVILTNGRQTYALSGGEGIHFVERNGIHDAPEGFEPSDDRSGAVRYVMTVAGAEAPAGYQSVPKGAVLVIDRDLSATVHDS